MNKGDNMKDYVSFIREKVGKEKIILNAAGVVITKDNKILLQKRSDNNEWGLIGGIMEIDETFHETAIREAKEETGLEVKLDNLIGIYHNYDMMWPNGDKAHVICAVYRASIISGTPRIDKESLELKFFGKDELPYIHASDNRQAVEDFFLGKVNQIK